MMSNVDEIEEELRKMPRLPFQGGMKKVVADVPHLPGIYAIWEGDELLYIGVATKNQPSREGKKAGLADRLGSHSKGTFHNSTVALALWFKRLAPTCSCDQLKDPNFDARNLTRNHVRQKLTFTFAVLRDATTQEIAAAEKALRSASRMNPSLNAHRTLPEITPFTM